MQRLEAGEKALGKLFCADYDFLIPDYQRPYAWGMEQAAELLDDLSGALDRDEGEPYFLGSIVLIKQPDVPRAEVVDGQQRLTTLTILFAVLAYLAADEETAGELRELILEPGKKLLGLEAKPRLELRRKDSGFFRKYVQSAGRLDDLRALNDNELDSDAQRAIQANTTLILERLDGWTPERRLALGQLLLQRTYLVVVSTADLASAYRIFNVLNTRGLDLSPADVFKSQVIGAIGENGRWYYQLELPPRAGGTRRNPLRRGGFATQADAEQEMGRARELLAIAAPCDTETAIRIADAIIRSVRETGQLPDPARVRKAVGGGHDPAVRPPTIGEWLEEWLAAKKGLRPGTVRGYASHIRLYFQPHIGYISIDRLRVADVASVFEAIEELNEAITEARTSSDPRRRAQVKGRRLVGTATRQRIRATLRSAISTYMKQHQGMLPANVASLVELPAGDRPKPLVWTGERVRAWQHDFDARLAGARERANGGRVSPLGIWVSTLRPSPVMVWTPAQTQVFLARAARHRLYAMWRLIASRGLRRGEGCGLRRTDTDLHGAVTSIRWQITQLGWQTTQGAPKSDAGERQVALDADTITDLRAHRQRQLKEKEDAGDTWTESGFEFTNPDGTPLHPAAVTDMFEQIAYLAGLPPIRLHDLGHGAATLLLAAGHDMKVVQDTLGLSSITIAADTYTSVLPQLARQSAEDVAALIRPAAASRTPRGKGQTHSGKGQARPK